MIEFALPDLSSGIARHDCPWRDIADGNTARADDGKVAHADIGADESIRADPGSLANDDLFLQEGEIAAPVIVRARAQMRVLCTTAPASTCSAWATSSA
jgi:hypothetical protein